MSGAAFSEGDWFAVPLRDGGFAVGLVARSNPKAALLGYFFGPRLGASPSLEDLGGLRPGDAVLVGRFGHLGLKQGRWPVLGRRDDWDRTNWPMPVFVRYEELSGRSFNVTYDDDDPGRLLREDPISSGDASVSPPDGLMGAGYVEKVLTRLLEEKGLPAAIG